MDFKTLFKILKNILSSEDNSVNFPVMIRGRHGIGKSEVVYLAANWLNLEVVERRASQMQEGDVVGMPDSDPVITDKGTKVATFNSFDWLIECCENPRVLFLDEIDRAQPQIKQALMELTDSRKIFGKILHPGTIIMSAVNGGKYGAEYQVGELDPAELDRWVVFDVEPTVLDWLDWAKDKVHPTMHSFIELHPEHLEFRGPYEPGKVYPSRRSTVRLDAALQRAKLYDMNDDNALSLVEAITEGFSGIEVAMAFRKHLKTSGKGMQARDIIVDGRWRETKGWSLMDHIALVQRIGNSPLLDSPKWEAGCYTNLANYFTSMPSESAADFWTKLTGHHSQTHSDNSVYAYSKGFEEHHLVKFMQTKDDNGVTVTEHFRFLLTGERDSGYSRDDMIKKHVEEAQSNHFLGISDAQSNHFLVQPKEDRTPPSARYLSALDLYNPMRKTIVV